MGTLNLGTGAQFVGSANGLTDAPTGTIIQTAIQGIASEVQVNADGSYTDVLSVSFTPRRSNSKIIYTLMFNAYFYNQGYSNGASYRVLRDSSEIKVGDWCFYLHHSQYNRDFYPVVNIFDFDEPGTTNTITYKMQGRKYQGNSNNFPTVFGEPQHSSHVGNSVIMKLEELSV